MKAFLRLSRVVSPVALIKPQQYNQFFEVNYKDVGFRNQLPKQVQIHIIRYYSNTIKNTKNQSLPDLSAMTVISPIVNPLPL
jgi:hypothetical protein